MDSSEEKAIVSHVKGDYVFLETQNTTSCDNCSTKSGCSQVSSIFTFKSKNKLRMKNSLSLKQGDAVIIAMAPDKLMLATVLMYLLPLVLLFVFSFIAKLLLGENASIIFGLVGLFFGLFLVKQFTQQKAIAAMFQPKLVRKIIPVNAT